jgi:thiol-disulfide isomerase/thioredoxin
MNIRLISIIGLFVCFISSGTSTAADAPPQDYQNSVDRMKLPLPADAQTREYLGVSQTDRQFGLAQIRADIVIVEIFNMYCPYCQKHAPMTNKLFQMIQGKENLKGRVKFIGIGIGNSPYEVGIFKKKYKILFPLFDDNNSAILNSLPGIRTPHYFAVKKAGGSHVDMFYSNQGSFDDEKVFLESVLQKSGLTF